MRLPIPNGAVRFENVTLATGWGCVTPDGVFQLLRDARRASAIGQTFHACTIDGKLVAVFGEQRLSEIERTRIAAHRPDWVHAVVYAEEARSPEPGEVFLDAAIDSSDGAQPEPCAFAAACIVLAEGRLKIVPDHFVVRFPGRLPLDAVVSVDDGNYTRYGYVLEFTP